MKTKNKLLSIMLCMLVITTVLPIVDAMSEKVQRNIQTSENNLCVNSKILLKKDILPLLKQSIRFIDNTNIKKLLQEMVRVLTNDVEINSNNLKEILIDLDLKDIGIYTGWIESQGEGTAITPRMSIKFLLREILFNYNLWEGIGIGPAIMCRWKAKNPSDLNIQPKTSINGIERYSKENEGIIIGFYGKITINIEQGKPLVRTSYEFRGIGSLIIITS